jgi:glycosyltransferase involved in cell wall biosynthesis
MPRVRASHPALKLYLIGYDPTSAVLALNDGDRVVVTGTVADVVPYLRRCALGVYPLRLGSGMPNKVLDALACGLPCIVSPTALAGIEHAKDGEHLRVATDAASWVDAITTLLADAPGRAALAHRGQAMVHASYTWEANVARLLETWRAAVDGRHR